MAATIAISCPKCEKQIKAPAELAGKKIRCKECQYVFVVKAPPEAKTAPRPAAKVEKADKGKPGKPADDKAAKPAEAGKPAKAPDHEEEEGSNPYSVTEESFLPRCPYCAKELEEEDQVICLNCGYNMQTRERVQAKKTYETTGGEKFVWLLPGILCAVGLLIVITCIVLFWTLFPKLEKDNEAEWWSFFFALWARIWGTVLFCFIGFFCGLFAVKRLILNPTAPEKEKAK